MADLDNDVALVGLISPILFLKAILFLDFLEVDVLLFDLFLNLGTIF